MERTPMMPEIIDGTGVGPDDLEVRVGYGDDRTIVPDTDGYFVASPTKEDRHRQDASFYPTSMEE